MTTRLAQVSHRLFLTDRLRYMKLVDEAHKQPSTAHRTPGEDQDKIARKGSLLLAQDGQYMSRTVIHAAGSTLPKICHQDC